MHEIDLEILKNKHLLLGGANRVKRGLGREEESGAEFVRERKAKEGRRGEWKGRKGRGGTLISSKRTSECGEKRKKHPPYHTSLSSSKISL